MYFQRFQFCPAGGQPICTSGEAERFSIQQTVIQIFPFVKNLVILLQCTQDSHSHSQGKHSQKQADTDERAREKEYKYYIEIYIPHLTACKVDFGVNKHHLKPIYFMGICIGQTAIYIGYENSTKNSYLTETSCTSLIKM